MKKIGLLSVLCALVLAACGGGGGSNDDGKAANNADVPPAVNGDFEAQGMYSGTDANGDKVSGVVLDNGTYYFVYVNQATNALGLVQGTATASNAVFNSADAFDYQIYRSTAVHGSVNAAYFPQTSLNGSFTSAANESASFSTTYSTVYDETPNLAAISGTYNGAGATFRGSETVTFVIYSNGSVYGSGPSGCSFSGNVKVHGTKNVYDTAIVFGDKCPNRGETFTGVVSVNGNALIAAATHPDRSEAFVVAATR
ncbi:hypothetical protein [Caballeronia sp. BR00000012568055]|uniref:hypothetical protein n=1 Tax=Caballeronia sp. BR00000012568055 TaxID=2918761 RepID=UPI0023FA2A21|nr:hypothetical protein [Caballeronia sp. BR00000012568055]